MSAAAVAKSEDVWQRAVLGWHLAFAVFALIAGVLVALEDLPVARRAGALALIAALSAWYVLTGRRAIHAGPSTRIGRLYIWVAMPVVVATVAMTPASTVLLFGLYPQVWTVLPTRQAIAASAGLTVVVNAVIVVRVGLSPESFGIAVMFLVLGILMSTLLGLWITKIIEQSRERAELVRRLEATQAELAAVSHEAGVLAERERLARDLHDTLAQGFTSTLLLLQAAKAALDRDGGQADACRDHLAHAEQAARENLAEVRSLVAALTPPALDGATLPAALERLTSRLGRELDVTATMNVHGTHRALPPNLEVALLRATQEALANVRKHSGARRVGVDLRYGDERVALSVSDDGCGFDPHAAPFGFGLPGLRNRVAALGGTVQLFTDPGVTVLVDLPLTIPEVGP
jgi:signal transduction histidine kinase